MITNDGILHIKRYLAGLEPAIAQSIAFGIGSTAEVATSTKLQFEVGRSDIKLVSYDFVNNRIVYKADVDDDFGGSIYEVALFSLPQDIVAGEYGSKIITSFDSATEGWVDASTSVDSSFVTTTRIGDDSLSHTPAAGTTKSDVLSDINMDFSGYSAADLFVLAYNVANSNTSGISYRFMTDASNYYEFSLGAQTSGYKIVERTKGSATVVGTPDWSNITQIQITTTSGAGGASNVYYDGLRVDDVDSNNPDYTMIAREVLTTVFVKQEGKSQEIEFSIEVNIT